MDEKIIYISSPDYLTCCDQHTKIEGRATIVHELIRSYGMFQSNQMKIVPPYVASKKDLLLFHTEEYIDFLEKCSGSDFDDSAESEELEDFGLAYDCSIFPEIYKYVKYVAGATLTAVKYLTSKTSRIAVNLNGGWHHACADEASGFCYVNDVVIGILEMMKCFYKVLYVDLDCHHCDAVEDAFHYSKKVLTFSIHKYESGFFPGSGGSSRRYGLNLPVKSGLRDNKFIQSFSIIYEKIIENFKPDAIVCQCGADALNNDPLGGLNLSEQAIPRCVDIIAKSNLPLLILGGGGYNTPNTARCWAQLIATLLNKKLSNEIPDHENLDIYKPDFCLNVSTSNRKDENTDEYLHHVIYDVTTTLESICISQNNCSK